MKFRFVLALLPVVAFAGTFSGSVVSLEGAPIPGAVVKAGTDSDVTTANGSWTLARSTYSAYKARTAIRITPHLVVEYGRPRLSFAGMDIAGRHRSTAFSSRDERAQSGAEGELGAIARAMAASDTLYVYWKGKRLTVLPVPSDTGSVIFRIDTAWKGDAGIPWNPRIAYGSLTDARDGQTYRTIVIEGLTWMAENMNYRNSVGNSDTVGKCYSNREDSCSKYGRLYTWEEGTDGFVSNALNIDGVKGICPAGWHLPSDAEWTRIQADPSSTSDGTKLKSTSGWMDNPSGWVLNGSVSGNGTDASGFRALPGGYYQNGSGLFLDARGYGYWWSSTEYSKAISWNRIIYWAGGVIRNNGHVKEDGFSLRCSKDTL